MESRYDHKVVESRIYRMWEEGGYFTPNPPAGGDKARRPFTIVLPPPNASGKMHTGNVLMIAIEDLLVRWHRMKGEPTLWIPGTDHAGIETQTTFERELKKQGKSRFDFDRQTLYQMVWGFVQDNKGQIESQIRQMGASVDWTRLKFTLDPDVIRTVYSTFKKMHDDGLIYRGDYLINYSFKHGTTFSDAEVHYVERSDPLYFIKYRLAADPAKFIEVASVRPELIMVDTHLAVNPGDKKQAKLAGQKVLNPLTDKEMEIFTDPFVDPKFGTGIVKLTPAHDKADYQVATTRKDLAIPIINAIDWNGRLNKNTGDYEGLTIKESRGKAIDELTKKGLLDPGKTNDKYIHQVPVDIRSDDYVENLILPNWFVRVDDPKFSLKQKAYDAVKTGALKIFPKWQEIKYRRWVENLHDWAISRQNVWGIRIPVWYEVRAGSSDIWVSWINAAKEPKRGNVRQFLEDGVGLEEIKKGLQRVMVLPGQSEPKYRISDTEPGVDNDPDIVGYLPETDTFDTWFSSSQWPLVTLGYPGSSDFQYFYPTSVLETGWEIVTRWVSRMVMFGYYLTGKSPFEKVYLHGHVRATDGRKMSKSLGNVINPDDYLGEFGADALRMGMISGTATGKDFNFPRDKVIAYRNFANKLWNIARFIEMNIAGKEIPSYSPALKGLTKEDKEILRKLKATIKHVDMNLTTFKFSQAAEIIYQFVWHELADKYIEKVKERKDPLCLSILLTVYLTCLKLLHPFMPFVTEEIWGLLPHEEKTPLIISSWPVVKN